MCPDTAAYYGNRSACHMMLGDYKSALEDARHSVYLDPKFEKGFVRMAKCCVTLGDIVGAEQAIKKTLELDVSNKQIGTEIQCCRQLRQQSDLATACFKQQDYRTAIYHADNALKLAPAGLKFKLLKAECLALLGRIEVTKPLFFFEHFFNIYFNTGSQRFGRCLHAIGIEQCRSGVRAWSLLVLQRQSRQRIGTFPACACLGSGQ